MWFLDSGCLRHMTGDISLFIDFVPKNKGFVTYGDNNNEAILGKGSVGNPSSTTSSNVMLGIKNVSDIKTNLKFADHSRKDAYGIAEDVLVTIEDLIFPVDFVILDIPEDDEAPIILGQPFMQTSRCNFDMDQGTLTFKVCDKEITLNDIKDQELEEDIESHYQVGLIRT
ncbi:hypothetical protein KIW84_073585 [Lathyrus oleraceus]|uniref:Retrovirus-related Pol polyprotein from transposon TNT 1-94-like beta-barrel domain-containing protein n=1 Tax=Pisum sativum TaxID=3888 RepID=A0A9D4ZVT0_PEA|nr:hypothetical protein KIW84_073585 [Pisum sativum]